jgi:hypothetical protein
VRNRASYDLQDHAAKHGVPAGKGVVEGGEIPYQPWAVAGSDGKVVNWALETGGANGLYRRGWRKEDLPAGTDVIFEGWQARNGKPTANISSITFKDGRRLFAGTSNNAAPQQ